MELGEAMLKTTVRRWDNGPLLAECNPNSRYRFVLEAIDEHGILQWCGSFRSVMVAAAQISKYRKDWQYRVFDCCKEIVVADIV